MRPDEELAGRAVRHVVLVLVDDPALPALEHPAARLGLPLSEGDPEREVRLRRAVELGEGDAEALLEILPATRTRNRRDEP